MSGSERFIYNTIKTKLGVDNISRSLFFYRDLLQRDPEFRPSAAEILLGKLPGLTVQYESHYYDDIEGMEEALVDRVVADWDPFDAFERRQAADEGEASAGSTSDVGSEG